MGLFSKKPNTNKILDEALCDYKAERFESCYNKVCEAAELGSPRAYFCKALLMYNDNVFPNSSPDVDTLESLTRTAMDGGYTLAYGFYAFILNISAQNERLCEFLAKKSSVKDGVYLLYKASYMFGIYTDEEQASPREILATMQNSLQEITNSKVQFELKKSTEVEEWELYNPYTKFSLDYTYARINYLLMTAYYYTDNWDNRAAFMKAFEETFKYMPVLREKFSATLTYLRAILDNDLGMSDLSEANRAVRLLNDCFPDLDDEEDADLKEKYAELYEKYDEFYDVERENIDNREVSYSDGYADKNDLTLKNFASAIHDGMMNFANSASSEETTTVYTINNVRYTRGDQGYLYDESGIRSEYRVDDYSRLYDGNGRELGYFNTQNLFISH
ncbi:MAG: hypothetical protein E7678_03955 [Ruminococcaceae bacterium]|nr:hypothetical protein [Oscillospiraceae bacterium]